MRRIVITGMGVVTPLGIGLERVWKRLIASESGIGAIQSFDVSDLPSRIAAQVPRGETSEGLFNADDWVPPKDQASRGRERIAERHIPVGRLTDCYTCHR